MAISPDHINQLTDHLFRREAGKMVAVLTKIFGAENLETAEDVVQDTLLHAMQSWTDKGIPDNPSAWLFRVAKNKAIDIIRRNKHSVQFDFTDDESHSHSFGYTLDATMDHLWQEAPVKDDMLRMMFACCHPGVSEENQVTIILKTLCGFSTAEIAKAFLTSEDTISKRLYRTKEFFRDNRIKLEIPSIADLEHRTAAVLNAIYLLFNEGYNSTHSEDLIRKDVMEEAMLLCKLLTENVYTQTPSTFALMALMCFHASRTESRLSTAGEIILLSEQDRGKWDRQLIAFGNAYMERAAFGNTISRYHLEAAIAYEHCIAESYAQTNWRKILEYYDWLCETAPSAITELNRAVVVMLVHGPSAALVELEQIKDRKKLASFYLYNSLLGELHARLDDLVQAKQYFETAIAQTQSETEKRILRNKISKL
ncbi:sigma-70 family RNA polymerase sigma factor [uncultured Chitinophaga sp.]|uniref:RNA polymerase sigma factor n=1 Tax=uncultured Chitinophaga sp. TaxID=339340 RepID=UPI0026384F45|nr:sigma-70 family RNA polymerase sigma factor [uncultured Chitinophaga sp.]